MQENTALLKEFRDNIISILGRMDAMGGVMREMPVLPVALNAELARNFLGEPGASAAMGGLGSMYQGTEDFPMYPHMPVMGVGHMGGGPGTAPEDFFPDMGMQPEGLSGGGVPIDLNALPETSPVAEPAPSQPGFSVAPAGDATQPGSAMQPVAEGFPTASAPGAPAETTASAPATFPAATASGQLPMPATGPGAAPPGAAPSSAPESTPDAAAGMEWQPADEGAPAYPELPAASMSEVAAFLADASGDSGFLADGLLNDGPAVSSGPTSEQPDAALLTESEAALDHPREPASAAVAPAANGEPRMVDAPAPANGSAAAVPKTGQAEAQVVAKSLPAATRSVPVAVRSEPASGGASAGQRTATQPVAATGGALGKRPSETRTTPSPKSKRPAAGSDSRPVDASN